MTHSAFGPTVSFEEAQRIERETADHLLKSRKLSLIVDLDQTIVHATVDPTVGEWIAEGEAWEARQAKKAAHDSDDSDDSSSDDDDNNDEECNPNWEALRDVKKFRLGPESFVPPSLRGAQQGKGKQKLVENEGCMYYIKPRSVFFYLIVVDCALICPIDPVGKSSCKKHRQSMRCMFIPWGPAHMRSKFVLQ